MKLELFKVLDFLWSHGPARLRPRAYSPDIEIVGNSHRLITELCRAERERHGHGPAPTFLEVGGRSGERAHFADGFTYRAMDLEPLADDVVVGDICECPEIPDDRFDVVASFDVFEHVERPWDAARECIRITKPGGLLIHRTLFAYRYHPIPVDYWRFSAQGLEHLFTRDSRAETIRKGYDLRVRRRDARGGMRDGRDAPPVDWLGGFRENWRVLWVGRKRVVSAPT